MKVKQGKGVDEPINNCINEKVSSRSLQQCFSALVLRSISNEIQAYQDLRYFSIPDQEMANP